MKCAVCNHADQLGGSLGNAQLCPKCYEIYAPRKKVESLQAQVVAMDASIESDNRLIEARARIVVLEARVSKLEAELRYLGE